MNEADRISRKQFRDAMVIVETYCSQVQAKAQSKGKHDIGCRVKLSKWGIEMQGNRKKKLVGKVVTFSEGAVNKITDGCVVIKWDGRKKPDSMHISQIEELTLTPTS